MLTKNIYQLTKKFALLFLFVITIYNTIYSQNSLNSYSSSEENSGLLLVAQIKPIFLDILKIDDELLFGDFKYTNPSCNKLHFFLPKLNKGVKIVIYNLNGNKVFNGLVDSDVNGLYTVNHNFPYEGFYLMQIEFEKSKVIRKIIKKCD